MQIAGYLEKAKEERKKVELKKKQLNNECGLLDAKESSITQEIVSIIKERDMTAEKLDWYLEMKTELVASGPSEKDFELVLKAINFSHKENGYNFPAIAVQFGDREQLKSAKRHLQIQNSILDK